MRTLLISLLLISITPLHCQFYDSFDSDHLDQWTGDTAQFMVNSNQRLQLRAGQADQALLLRKVDSLPEAIFTGSVSLDFSPSKSNRLKMILAQYPTPDSIQYALEIGDTGSPDTLFFAYYSQAFQFRYPLKAVFEQQVTFTYNILIDQDEWIVSINPEGGSGITEAITPPPLPGFPFFFGIRCEFTSTRSDKFYFDDLGVGMTYLDTIPPRIQEISIIDSATIQFYWNEDITVDSIIPLGSLSSFEVESYEKIEDSSTLLILRDGMLSGTTYAAQIYSRDLFENHVQVDTHWTYYHTPLAQPGDLLITEIMADPIPALALPECEYIEIYNPTDLYFRLSDYTISDDRRQAFLSDTIIAPRSYYFLVDVKNKSLYEDWPNVLFIAGLPTINNDVDIVRLQDYVGRSIHEVYYDRNFFDDSDRSAGGWSLEMKDVRQPCLQNSNWTAADLIHCGSPGKGNTQSIKLTPHDLVVEEVRVTDPKHIHLRLNQSVYPINDIILDISPDLGSSQYALDPSTGTMDIYFEKNMTSGTDYRLSIKALFSCIKESHDSLPAVHFFLPSEPKSAELQINEVLFNPYSGGVDFVEIMNTSETHLSLKHVCLGLINSMDTIYTCIQQPLSIPPNDVKAWTNDSSTLKQHYAEAQNMMNEDLISIPDEGGHLQLWLARGGDTSLLDQAFISDQDHSPALVNSEGVSLQKIYGSWTSSTPSMGATPGWQPSFPPIEVGDDSQFLSIAYDQYSPNADGYKDHLPITISPSKPGFNVRLDIFDWNGKLICSLLEDTLINEESIVLWQGQTDQGLRAIPGAYIVMGFFAHPDGDLFREKVTCIVN